ncbi:galactose-specific lectin nattectin-like [Chanodichthys erythropterus]|uniref:galactose-specific lectin nattectin-like n=1 Tax=Chanodichthys erythropterus TaxID=933992 RepID=UPI00351F7B79
MLQWKRVLLKRINIVTPVRQDGLPMNADASSFSIPNTRGMEPSLGRQTTHASTPAWIGGHKGYYRWFWSDGSKMNYQIWSPGQPSNGADELCVEMNSVNGNWNDVKCHAERPYVCVK